MIILPGKLKLFVTALLLMVMYSIPANSQTAELDRLFVELSSANDQSWEEIEQNIWREWSKSGSSAMDLLLVRGRRAMAEGDLDTAIGHLTALTDHASDFAEGWNARATAYYQAGLFGPSIADIRRTLALNPRHFGALSGLGMILEQLDYPKDALEAYRAVLAIHPFRPALEETVKRLEKEVGGTDI